MPAAPIPPDEASRLQSLHRLGILDTPQDAEFDAIARAAALACSVPMSQITLIDENRQWFKAHFGPPGPTQTPREAAICGYTILSDNLLEITDATADPRVADSPLVTGAPGIRFYAGAPLRLSDGARVGTLCVIDQQPRKLDDKQIQIITALAEAAAKALESWRDRHYQARLTAERAAAKETLHRQYEATPAMIHALDAEGRIVAVSETWLVKLGYAREEVMGRMFAEFLTPSCQNRAREVSGPQLPATGSYDRSPAQMVCKDGSLRDVQISSTVECDEAGRPIGRRTVIEDVTLQLAAERALTAESRRLANIIDSTAMGTWEWNVQTDEVRINARWAELIGYTIEDLQPLTGNTWYLHMHPDDRASAKAHLHAHLKAETERYDCEFRIRHRDGRWIWVFSRGALISRTQDGKPEWLFATRKDISQRKHQEEAHRKSEDFLDRTGRAAGVGGWELDLQTNELHWSAETCRIYGLPENHQPTAEAALNFHPPEARVTMQQAMTRSAQSGEAWDLELPVIRADGRQIWVRAVGGMSEAAGNAHRLTGAVQDITDRVEKRLALQAANERIRLAADSGGVGLWDWDLVADIKIWDQRMHLLYGLAPAEGPISHHERYRRVHPDDLAAAKQAVQDAFAGLRPYDTEFRVVWDDGSIHHLRAAARVTRDSDGRPVRMIGVSWDVTESRNMAADLTLQLARQAEAVERETALFRSSPDSLSIIRGEDINGEMVFRFEALSPAFATLSGWRLEDFVGRRLQDCLPREAARAAHRQCLACLSENATISFAMTVETPKGMRDFEGSRTPIRPTTDTKIVRIATSTRDVTERKRLEAAELHGQKMEAIGRLAAGVAHDFNNMLQSITGSLELVQDEVAPGTPAHDHAAIGLRATTRGSYLTHHLLSYARKQLLRPRVIELPTLLKDLEKLLARTLGPNIVVAVRADTTMPTVRTDPGQLQTALLNLAINGSHAMPNGGTLMIESRPIIDDGRNCVCLSVSDTGTGMDEITMARATEPFFTTKGLDGTGLGLSMVHGFAEQSGGRIRITSILGQGTTVAILLPAAPEPVRQPGQPVSQPSRISAKILVVDDDSDVLVTTGAFLEKAGFATIRAPNADQALALLASGAAVHAIVTDYAMPGMNGSDLIQEARLARPGLPAVLISGFTEFTDMTALSDTTITLQKPFQRDALVSALRHLLEPESRPQQTCGHSPD